jgi:transposase-like protein
MRCPTCQSESQKFGKNRNGSQRFRCLACRKTFTPSEPQPLGQMRLAPDKAIMCLHMLMEGTSIRCVERLMTPTSTHG